MNLNVTKDELEYLISLLEYSYNYVECHHPSDGSKGYDFEIPQEPMIISLYAKMNRLQNED